MTGNEGLSERIRNRRIELGLSQAQLSRDTGIAAPQLSRYESGANEPRADIAAKLAKALGVTYEWLLDGRGDKYIPQAEEPQRLNTKSHLLPVPGNDVTTFLSNKTYHRLLILANYNSRTEEEEASILLSQIVDFFYTQHVNSKITTTLEKLKSSGFHDEGALGTAEFAEFNAGLAEYFNMHQALLRGLEKIDTLTDGGGLERILSILQHLTPKK